MARRHRLSVSERRRRREENILFVATLVGIALLGAFWVVYINAVAALPVYAS